MARTDLQLLENDLIISDGDLIVGASDSQHVEDTINSVAGWWKENYMDGVNIRKYLKSKNSGELSRSMILQLANDGYVANPIIKMNANGQLTINPNVTI